ncbi:MAG: 1-deoxy-D-xylulose-5-phosphate reductoisomerase, partial [Bacteroidales bacterium]
ALDVIAAYPDLFEVYTLTANNNADLLIEQAKIFLPDSVVIANEELYNKVSEALKEFPVKVYAGSNAVAEIVESTPIDIVLTAMMGYAGLYPTIRAVKAGKKIALANKETLVVAGELINMLVEANKAVVIPVDSEHSAIFQCLAGEEYNPIDKILLTASGGPFLHYTQKELECVTKTDALKHPNWSMGAKITIDSASMMNKGFEMIEAKWLFGITPEQVEVVIHPQSIVHSMVQFIDGAVKAQFGVPDMKLPISYALSYPKRLKFNGRKLSIADYAAMTFEAPDNERFPLLSYAYQAINRGGNMPCVLNAANEVAVAAFLEDKIKFTDIPHLVYHALEKAEFIASPNYENYVTTDTEVRIFTNEDIKTLL